MRRIAADYIQFHVDEEGYERIAFAEMLLPDQPNSYGDLHNRESVRKFSYGFMINGFGIDVNHDNVDVSDKVRIVESFIAREGDPDFVVGAWVVGIHVLDDDIWNGILSGELNGFSYEALVSVLPVKINVQSTRDVVGVTLPDVIDGHTHSFYVRLDANGRVIAGGTAVSKGHSHTITSHTVTEHDSAETHKHRFSVYEEITDDAAA